MFSETVTASLVGLDVNVALLCLMDFEDAPRRWWMGAGPLDAGGHEWQGLGQWASVEGLSAPIGTAAPETMFTLSGVDPEIVALARAASSRVKGRDCTVYLQFFHGHEGVPDPIYGGGLMVGDNVWQVWGLLDEPYAILTGTMESLTFASNGPSERSITVMIESLWVDRNRAPSGLYTPIDQRTRFAGDRGLDQVPDLVDKTIHYPVFVLGTCGLVGLALKALALHPILGIV